MRSLYLKTACGVVLGILILGCGAVWANKARVLIVVSDGMVNNACPTCYAPWDFYHENYLTLFDEWNDIYANSNMDYSVEIAGVIWDKTYNDQVSGLASLFNIENSSHPDLGKYHAMVEAYSADYLVLHSQQYPSSGAAGWAAVSVPAIGSPAVFWTNNIGAYVWVHEAGHKHALEHCDGYRQTYDAGGNFVLTGAVWGFHTVMQYSGGVACSDPNHVGDQSLSTQFASAFADPNESFNYGSLYPLGDPMEHGHTVPQHIAADATIRVLFNTPNNIDLGSNMKVGEIEYANFIASDQVRLNPGFSVQNGLLRISVGSQAMAKRGIPADSYVFHEDKKKNAFPSFVRKFDIVQFSSQREIRIEYEGEMDAIPEVSVFDATGRRLRGVKSAEIIRTERGFHATIDMSKMGAGEFFLRLRTNQKTLYRKFSL